METLFAAIAIPCLVFFFADYLYNWRKNWIMWEKTEKDWELRKDDKDYENKQN